MPFFCLFVVSSFSKTHGILAVGGEPIKKEDARRAIQEIVQETQTKKSKRSKKDQKAILNCVEQLNLAPMDALKNYYQVCEEREGEGSGAHCVCAIGKCTDSEYDGGERRGKIR